MADQLTMRPYQRETVDAVFSAWSEGMNRPAVVLPCGAGKTVIFSHLAPEFRSRTGKRSIVLVNRDELCDQSIDKLRSSAPGLRIGKVKATDDETDADVVVASIQTLARPARLGRLLESDRSNPFGLVITDECHFAAARSYVRVMGAFPEAVHAGFTATLERGDGVGLGSVWDDVVYSKSILWMIANGYLVDVRGQEITADGLDLSSVGRSRGDYQSGSLGEALVASGANEVAAAAYQEYASDRPGIVFTPSVASAHDLSEQLKKSGISAAVVSGETPRDERLRAYEDSRTGRVQVLVNCQVLTTGFDAPWISCAMIARPTQSRTLWIQMAGRALRTWPGKKDALILNLGGSNGNKLTTLIDLEPGAVTSLRDGESLAEAIERENEEAKEGQAFKRVTASFSELRSGQLDLFGASEQTWLRTQAGIMFVPAGEGEVLLWPSRQPGMWDVVYAPKTGPWERLHEALDMGLAMAWAETEADERAGFNVRRKASWRRTKASEKQLVAARRMGIVADESMKRGEVGDLISVKIASRRLDRFVRRTK